MIAIRLADSLEPGAVKQASSFRETIVQMTIVM
jgi:hypothetical protein